MHVLPNLVGSHDFAQAFDVHLTLERMSTALKSRALSQVSGTDCVASAKSVPSSCVPRWCSSCDGSEAADVECSSGAETSSRFQAGNVTGLTTA